MNIDPAFKVVSSLSQAEAQLLGLQGVSVVGIDTETTGLDPLSDKVRLVQVAIPGHPVLIFDLWYIDRPAGEVLREIMCGPQVKIFQNAKFDMKFLRQRGLPVAGRIFDTLLAGQLLRQKTRLPKLGLDSLVQHYLAIELPKEQQKSDWTGVLSPEQYRYAARDAAVLLPLRDAMIRDLKAEDMLEVAKLEFGCVGAVVEMELTGIQLDLERWKRVGERLEQEKTVAMRALKAQLETPSVQLSFFGDRTDELNLDSHHQVLQALKQTGIPITSTSKHQLIPLGDRYPVVRDLLAYRGATKALQGFIYSIPETIHPVSGRIHPQYHQIGASTGRFSCGNPNLQQIPRSQEFRSCFVAAPGQKLVIADYSQIELRVVAEISRDETMIKAYTQGQDLHRLTASLVANKALDDVTKAERQAAKAVNFGLVYAMGARGLSAYARMTYGVAMSLEEAETFRRRFFEAYQGVARWHQTLKMSKVSVSRTLGGRVYRWHEEASVTGLYNWPVQGTAADIVKRALGDLMVNLSGSSAKVIGMVHDEIIVEAREEEASDVAKILRTTMEHVGSYYLSRVPLVADTVIADNWAEK